MRSTRALRPLFALTLLLLPLGPLQAQRYWHDDRGGDALRLDVLYPFLKGDGYKFPTFAAIPSVSIRAAEGIRVEGDFPLTRAGYDAGGSAGTQTSFRVGNPYVGFRVGDDAKPMSGTLGVRLPLGKTATDAPSQAAVVTGIASSYDDYEAFAPNTVLVRAALEGRWGKSSFVGAKLGGSIVVPTAGNPLTQTVKYIDYGARAGVSGANGEASFALTGRLVSQSIGGSGVAARTHHAVTAAVGLTQGMLRPRLSLRVPLDKDLTDVAAAVLGVGITVVP